ncbi:MAG: hypothetical protein ACRCZF_27220, partial [Gemmataceae bacterium]
GPYKQAAFTDVVLQLNGGILSKPKEIHLSIRSGDKTIQTTLIQFFYSDKLDGEIWFPQIVKYNFKNQQGIQQSEICEFSNVRLNPILQDSDFSLKSMKLPAGVPIFNPDTKSLSNAPVWDGNELTTKTSVPKMMQENRNRMNLERIQNGDDVLVAAQADRPNSKFWRTPVFIVGGVITLVGGVWWFLRRRATA